MLLSVHRDHPEPRKIARAAEVLGNGGLIAYPTDTVYGLGCDLMNKQAIEELHMLKAMAKGKPLSFICPDLSDIARYAVVDNATYRVLRHHLPGPYTFVLQATREVPKIAMTRQKTVGIRVPDHPVTQALVRALGRPLINTTASRDGEEPLIDPWEIQERYPTLDLVIDCETGGLEPTTIVDLSTGEVRVLREGAGPIDELV
ncbi:MAG: threonylcarbamoyl-AMP synthase [Polyangiaceae bacterium]|nr:threonylcarbamoyl-AMP synthase [Polyangiaceae bacterium]